MNELDWRQDWESFVASVAADLAAGMDDQALTAKYAGSRVSWTGRVTKVSLTEKYAPGVALRMPRVRAPVSDGAAIVTDHAFLAVGASELDSWSGIGVGDQLRFSALIGQGSELFPGVKIGKYESSDELELFLSLERATPEKTL